MTRTTTTATATATGGEQKPRTTRTNAQWPGIAPGANKQATKSSEGQADDKDPTRRLAQAGPKVPMCLHHLLSSSSTQRLHPGHHGTLAWAGWSGVWVHGPLGTGHPCQVGWGGRAHRGCGKRKGGKTVVVTRVRGRYARSGTGGGGKQRSEQRLRGRQRGGETPRGEDKQKVCGSERGRVHDGWPDRQMRTDWRREAGQQTTAKRENISSQASQPASHYFALAGLYDGRRRTTLPVDSARPHPHRPHPRAHTAILSVSGILFACCLPARHPDSLPLPLSLTLDCRCLPFPRLPRPGWLHQVHPASTTWILCPRPVICCHPPGYLHPIPPSRLAVPINHPIIGRSISPYLPRITYEHPPYRRGHPDTHPPPQSPSSPPSPFPSCHQPTAQRRQQQRATTTTASDFRDTRPSPPRPGLTFELGKGTEPPRSHPIPILLHPPAKAVRVATRHIRTARTRARRLSLPLPVLGTQSASYVVQLHLDLAKATRQSGTFLALRDPSFLCRAPSSFGLLWQVPGAWAVPSSATLDIAALHPGSLDAFCSVHRTGPLPPSLLHHLLPSSLLLIFPPVPPFLAFNCRLS